jgi:AraC-like DNA-binding protein
MSKPELPKPLIEFVESFSPVVDYVGYFTAKPGWVSEPEDLIRDVVNFWYITEGSGAVRIDGQWVEFSAHDLITIKPGENYDQEKASRKNPYKVYFVQFYPFKENNSTAWNQKNNLWPRVISLKYYPEIKDLFTECFDTFNTSSSLNHMLEKSILFRVLHIVTDAYQNLQPEISSKSYEKFIQAKQYIDNHFFHPLSLELIAGKSNLSSSRLSTLFNTYLNISPINYQISVKFKYARLYLAKGIPVTKVSTEVGFNSVHHFSRIFKKHFGMPPSQYAIRRRIK